MLLWMNRGVRLLLAATFLWAAVSKSMPRALDNPDTIYDQWLKSPAERYVWAGMEAAITLWIISGVCRRASAAVIIVLLSTFSGLIVSEMMREFPEPCGCMGRDFLTHHDPNAIRRSLVLDLARNGIMITGAAWLFFATPARRIQY
jgi:hypothetical protein